MKDMIREIIKIASLIEEEKDGTLYLGPYNEIESAYMKLKSYGGKWDSGLKRLVIPTSSLSLLKRKNLQKIIDSLKSEETDNTGKKQQEKEKFENLKKNLKKLEIKTSEKMIEVFSPAYNEKINETCRNAGGRWDAGNWKLDIANINLKNIEDFISTLKEIDEMYEKRYNNVLKIASDLPKNWNNIGAWITIYNSSVIISNLGRENKDIVKSRVKKAKYEPSSHDWSYNLYEENSKVLNSIVEDIKNAKSTVLKTENQINHCNPNRKSGICYICNQEVEIGEGCLVEGNSSIIPKRINNYFFQKLMDAGDDTVWLVRHKDTSICDKNIAIKEEMRKLRENREAIRQKLINIIKKDGTMPSGSHNPQGKKIDLRKAQSYDGGDWLIIDNDDIWYINYNGGDGDDWRNNNINNGNGGNFAEGWKTKYTEELKNLVSLL